MTAKKRLEVLRKLRLDGWYQLKNGSTSHRQFKHPTKTGKVTVTVKGGGEISGRDFRSILSQMELTLDEWELL